MSKPINALCGQNPEYLMLKIWYARIITTVLQRLNTVLTSALLTWKRKVFLFGVPRNLVFESSIYVSSSRDNLLLERP
jgi:hypothetical protein